MRLIGLLFILFSLPSFPQGEVQTKNVKLKNSLNALQNDIELMKGKMRDLISANNIKPSSKFVFKGHFQARTESARNRQGSQGVKQSGQTFSRLRLDSSFHPNEKLGFFLSPQATKIWGGVSGGAVTSGTTNQPNLTFFKAFIKYEVSPGLTTTLGRQELSYGDDLILGALPWANNGRSFDALKFRYSFSDDAWLDAFWSKLSDNSDGNANSSTTLKDTDDKDLYGIYSSIKKTSYLNPLDFYFLRQVDRTTTNKTEVNHLGFRIKGSVGGFFYTTENGFQSGANHGDDAYSLDFIGGYKMREHKISIQYSSAGKSYFQFYPTAHKFLGFADVLGRKNVDQIAAHFHGNLLDNLNLVVSYHNFKRNDTSATATKLSGAAWGTVGASDDIGQEVDLVANILTENALKLQLGACLFMPGQYLKDQDGSNKDSDVKFFYAQVNAHF